MSERRLGRGIASLLNNDDAFDILSQSLQNSENKLNEKTLEQFNEEKFNIKNKVVELELNDIIPNKEQPRKYFDNSKLLELSESIKNNGLLQPIIVSKNKNDKYVIIAGERRYRATKMANLKTIKAIVLELDEKDILKNAIIENVQREGLNPVEEANGYKKIIEVFGYTQERLANEVGKSRAHISNLLRILNLPEEVISALKNNNITLGHAKVLLSCNEPEKFLDDIIINQLSVRQLENLINNKQDSENNSKKSKKNEKNNDDAVNITFEMIKQLYSPFNKNENNKNDNINEELNEIRKVKPTDEEWIQVEKNVKIIETHLRESSGLNLNLQLKKDGSGKVEIIYEDVEDLLDIAKFFK